MLQVATANSGARVGAKALVSTTGYRRAAFVLGAVIVAHLLGLALLMAARDSVIVQRPLETRTITALLLSPQPQPQSSPAAPAPAVERQNVPPLARPAAPPPHAAPHAPAHATPAPPRTRVQAAAPRHSATAAPTAPALSASPSATTPPASDAAASPATPPAPSAPAPAPAQQPALSASSAPKNVAHVDCTIPRPDYPDMSKRRGENGTAIVRFVVGLAGRVETVELQKSSGYARLDDAALAAVHASVCRPYSENGTPMRAAYSQSFVFGLTE